MQLKLTPFEHLLHRFHRLPTPILDAFGSVLFGHILSIGVRRGLFEFLADGSRTSIEIARHLNMSEVAVRTILEVYTSGGYLKSLHHGYALTRESKRWLLRSSPYYIGNLIGYFESLYRRWGELEYTLEHGAPKRPYYEAFDEKDWQLYVDAMRDLARVLIPEVFRVMALSGSPKRLLDIGGSHGEYAMEFCRRYPELHSTIIDFPPALRHTEKIVREGNMISRVFLEAGDIVEVALPGDQDAVLLFNVIHGFTETDNLALVQRSIKALRPGGTLFILDQFLEAKGASGLGRFLPLMVGLNLLNEIGGRAYAFEEVKQWCSGASSVKYRKLRVPGVGLIEVKS